MSDILDAKSELFLIADKYKEKYELSKNVADDYYEPGMMENLDCYFGEFDPDINILTLRTEVKGLRYENRTPRLNELSVGDTVKTVRDSANEFNSNNFAVISEKNESLGSLPAELCNALAPLTDKGYAEIVSSKISYMEKLKDRSRYAKQGVLFLELQIRLRGL